MTHEQTDPPVTKKTKQGCSNVQHNREIILKKRYELASCNESQYEVAMIWSIGKRPNLFTYKHSSISTAGNRLKQTVLQNMAPPYESSVQDPNLDLGNE